jgi:hypothetical protein
MREIEGCLNLFGMRNIDTLMKRQHPNGGMTMLLSGRPPRRNFGGGMVESRPANPLNYPETLAFKANNGIIFLKYKFPVLFLPL